VLSVLHFLKYFWGCYLLSLETTEAPPSPTGLVRGLQLVVHPACVFSCAACDLKVCLSLMSVDLFTPAFCGSDMLSFKAGLPSLMYEGSFCQMLLLTLLMIHVGDVTNQMFTPM